MNAVSQRENLKQQSVCGAILGIISKWVKEMLPSIVILFFFWQVYILKHSSSWMLTTEAIIYYLSWYSIFMILSTVQNCKYTFIHRFYSLERQNTNKEWKERMHQKCSRKNEKYPHSNTLLSRSSPRNKCYISSLSFPTCTITEVTIFLEFWGKLLCMSSKLVVSMELKSS